jgi:putative endonuclease
MGIVPTIRLTQGHAAEDLAVRHLRKNGLKLLQRNYRSRFGEIDLIMRDHDTVVFVEVRYRRNSNFGAPQETVDPRKRARLRATAETFLQHSGQSSRNLCRFDIVALSGEQASLTWIQNAF